MNIGPFIIGLSVLLAGCTTDTASISPSGPNAAAANAGNAFVTRGSSRCITTDNVPDHSVGQFPNRGNPHALRKQTQTLCVPLNPVKGARKDKTRGPVGIALNGVQFRPETADYYDPRSPRGHSRDPGSGWNLEGIGAKDKLGMDSALAHVDERGLYHYHGVSGSLRGVREGTLLGYAADGFEIHYDPSQSPSYRLKSGTRPSGPGGRYDGTYIEDWQYVAGSGTLGPCNGGMKDGRFVYYATTKFPFFPRCLYGNISSDFRR